MGAFQKRGKKVRPLYEDAVKSGIKSSLALAHLGDSYMATERFKEALGYIKRYEESLHEYKILCNESARKTAMPG